MWKVFSRGLKRAFDSSIYKHSILPKTVVTQDSTRICYNKKFLPALVEHINRFYSNDQRCYDCESCQSGKRRRDYRARHEGPLDDVNIVFLEALGWSSVLVLGWYICQPFCRRSVRNCRCEQPNAIEKLRRHDRTDYAGIATIFSKLLFSKPINYVLPHVNATKEASRKTEQNHTTQTNVTEQDKYNESDLKVLEDAHKKVVGQLDNWLGTECMQLGKHAEATSHFHKAVKLENPAAMFNLGICCEMGLGTSQNFEKAAKLYQKASEYGHATAMYNLGIFHVHGWGGMEADVDRARELFKEAAKLGQKDAIEALALERQEPVDVVGGNLLAQADLKKINVAGENVQNNFKIRTISEGYSEMESFSSDEDNDAINILESEENYLSKIEPKSTDSTDLLLQVLGISVPEIQTQSVEIQKKKPKSVDSGILDLTSDIDLDWKMEKLNNSSY